MGRPAHPIGRWGRINAAKQPNGGWRATARYRDVDGETRTVERYAATRPKAEAALLGALEARSGITGGEISAESTFAELVAFWSVEAGGLKVRPQTLAEYRRLASANLLPPLGKLRVRELTVGHLDRFLKGQRATTPGLARNLRSLLSAILAIAVRHGALEANPVLGTAAVPRPDHVVRALDIDSALHLRAYARAFRTGPGVSGPPPTDELPDFIDFMLATGARVGEGLGVRWQDLNLRSATPTVTFSGTVVYVKRQGYFRQDLTKSSAGMRTVTLPEFAVEMLLRRAKTKTSAEFVFPSATGGLRQTQNLHRAWRAMREGTEWEWVTPHIFRKTVATLLDDASGTTTASKQLGHSSPEVTRRHYVAQSHVAPNSAAILQQLGQVVHLVGSAQPKIDDSATA